MKYFGFLARFVVIPLLILQVLLWRDRRRGRDLPESMQSWPEQAVLLGHVAVAVAYTTPWDNYLVATDVWSYDPKLVTGHTIGWVPIEEYTFFVLQTLMTGSLLLYGTRRIPLDEASSSHPRSRAAITGGLGMLWLASTYHLLKGTPQFRYMSLILSWALPPVMLQVGFGGDILWRNRRAIATTLAASTAYLGVTDSLAIDSGTWSINPAKTTGVEVIKNLPLEELLFFFMTNVLLTFGVTLVQSKESEQRLAGPLKDFYFDFKTRLLGAAKA
jgi:lycopene cyclase domain-containing protein